VGGSQRRGKSGPNIALRAGAPAAASCRRPHPCDNHRVRAGREAKPVGLLRISANLSIAMRCCGWNGHRSRDVPSVRESERFEELPPLFRVESRGGGAAAAGGHDSYQWSLFGHRLSGRRRRGSRPSTPVASWLDCVRGGTGWRLNCQLPSPIPDFRLARQAETLASEARSRLPCWVSLQSVVGKRATQCSIGARPACTSATRCDQPSPPAPGVSPLQDLFTSARGQGGLDATAARACSTPPSRHSCCTGPHSSPHARTSICLSSLEAAPPPSRTARSPAPFSLRLILLPYSPTSCPLSGLFAPTSFTRGPPLPSLLGLSFRHAHTVTQPPSHLLPPPRPVQFRPPTAPGERSGVLRCTTPQSSTSRLRLSF
jgi:hypothetical protein